MTNDSYGLSKHSVNIRHRYIANKARNRSALRHQQSLYELLERLARRHFISIIANKCENIVAGAYRNLCLVFQNGDAKL